MLKFILLPIGECFEYQDERYSKTGPLTAARLDNNQQRMIPRSALVKPMSPMAAPEPAIESTTTLAPETVATAFARYHDACLQLLAENGMDETNIRQQLEQERQRFLAACGLG